MANTLSMSTSAQSNINKLNNDYSRIILMKINEEIRVLEKKIELEKVNDSIGNPVLMKLITRHRELLDFYTSEANLLQNDSYN